MRYIFKIKTLIILFLVILSGCISDDVADTNIKSSDRWLSVSFASGALATTRVSDEVPNRDNLSFFLFREDNSGETSFVFTPEKAKVSVISDATRPGIYSVKFKIPDVDYKRAYLIVLQNYTGPNPNRGESAADFAEGNLVNSYSGLISQYNLPLYGAVSFPVNKMMISTSVTLVNSLAKINIVVDDQLYDASKHNYKINTIGSIRIYRTLDKSSVSYSPENMNVAGYAVKPTIPEGAVFNLNNGTSASIEEADKSPLLYNLDTPVTQYENKIYIPEKFHKSQELRKNVATIVVGVYLDDPEYMGKQRYYRIDFAKYEEGVLAPTEFYSILRNHLYKFSLAGAKDPGTEDPGEALTAESSLWLNLVAWQQDNMDSVINGDYYLKMQSSDVVLAYEQGSVFEIPFETNIPNDLSTAIGLKWGDNNETDNAHFSASVDAGNNKIIITAKQENATATPIEENLHITVMNHAFNFKIIQKDKRPDFYISQTNYTVSGVYVRNQQLEPGKHTIRVRLYARNRTEDLRNLRYSLSAPEVEGIYIEPTSGLFDAVNIDPNSSLQYQDITLNVSGISSHAKDKRITVLAEGKEISFLNATIPFAYIPKKILGLFGSGSVSGLKNMPNFNKLISSEENFGLTMSSAVKSEPITYVESFNTNLAAVIQAEQPDVIIWGEGYTMNIDQAIALQKYMLKRNELNAPGVVIAINSDYNQVLTLFNTLGLIDNGVTPENVSMSHTYGDITPGYTTDTHSRYRLPVYDWDLGVEGSFGAVGTRYIQLKESSSIAIKGISFGETLKYTGNLAFAQRRDPYDYAVSSCRFASIPLCWIGDKHFLVAQNQWIFSGNKLINLPPLTYTSEDDNYTMKLTTNSIFFANLLEWAFHTSEYGLN